MARDHVTNLLGNLRGVSVRREDIASGRLAKCANAPPSLDGPVEHYFVPASALARRLAKDGEPVYCSTPCRQTAYRRRNQPG